MKRKTETELLCLVKKYSKDLCKTETPSIQCLGGHASSRIYHRVSGIGSFIIMELGDNPLNSEEASTNKKPKELPFLTVQRFLDSGKIAVPKIYDYLQDVGLILLEDLGDDSLESVVTKSNETTQLSLYQEAILTLVDIQKFTATKLDQYLLGPKFEPSLLRWELDHFKEWLLETDRKAALSQKQQQLLSSMFDKIVEELHSLPYQWTHRDFQSRNLMVQKDKNNKIKLRVIDFQDALLGPFPYDLVALLRDSYVNLGISLVEKLIAFYLEQKVVDISPEEFQRAFWLQTVQRKLKDAGRFIFIHRVKNNSSFLPYIPLSLQYVKEAFEKLPGLIPLADLLGEYVPELKR